MSLLNLADIITADQDPEEIFEILELLGNFYSKKISKKAKEITDQYTRLFTNQQANWWLSK
jgi:hypothetical protein